MNRSLLIIFLCLLALLALTILASFADLPNRYWSLGIALTIAVAKAVLIALFFMHLKYDTRVTIAVALAGVLWLGILTVLTAAEYVTRNHPPFLNYKGEPRYLQAETP